MKSLVILITGATSGIGRNAALSLAGQGHRVFATGRREAELRRLLTEAKDTPLETLTLDVTSTESIDAARLEIDRRTAGHGVDVLVNNAGYGLLGPLAEITDKDLRKQYDTNVFGLMAVTRAFLPAMQVRGSGRIVNVSSIGGLVTIPMMGAYNSTKYAVESLSDALRNELSPFGVHVSLIEPGVIRTEFSDRAMESISAYRSPDSPYANVLLRAAEVEQRSMSIAVGPEVITRAITRAIHDRHPSARYVAPGRAKLMVLLARLSPTWLVDRAMRWFLGLTPKRVTAKPAALPAVTAAAP